MGLCTVIGINIPVSAKGMNDTGDSELIFDETLLTAGSTFGEATDISVNSVVTDNLESENDTNFYKFSVGSDGYVSFNFNHQYVDGDYVRWVLQFYNLDQNKLFETTYKGNVDESKTITTQNVGIPAGTYYVCIKPYDRYDSREYSTSMYNLYVNYNVDYFWETEFNDVISTSDLIQTNQFYNGSSMTNSDDDYYRFELNEDGCVNLMFTHDYVDGDYQRWKVTLYDVNEKELFTNYYKGNVPEGSVSQSCNVGLSKGKYYVKVAPYDRYDSREYSFVNYGICIKYTSGSGYEAEFNNLFSTANVLSANQTITGNQMTESDVDYYCFDNKKDGIVNISFSHDIVEGSYSRWRITLYDINEKELWHEDIKGNSTESYVNKDWLSSGKYYIKVSPYDRYDSREYTYSPYYLNVNYYDGREIPSQTMYRLYFSGNGEHFYTADEGERDYLTSIGWDYEGEAWQAPLTSNTPVYRLFNPRTGEHHYTSDAHEKDVLSSQGWNYEGIGWYSDDFGGTAMIRLFNPNTNPAGSHHYTKDESEYNYLVNSGWIFEGVGWYGL